MLSLVAGALFWTSMEDKVCKMSCHKQSHEWLTLFFFLWIRIVITTIDRYYHIPNHTISALFYPKPAPYDSLTLYCHYNHLSILLYRIYTCILPAIDHDEAFRPCILYLLRCGRRHQRLGHECRGFAHCSLDSTRRCVHGRM